MPPLPKDPSTRARRNKNTATARTTKLHVVENGAKPELPDTRQWDPQTLAWWADLWASPMAPEYDTSDVHGLVLLAVLIDDFWKEPTKDLAGEIRLQRQCYGLTPIDRRRLQWEIERGEEAEEKRQTRRTVPTKARKDPRKALA